MPGNRVGGSAYTPRTKQRAPVPIQSIVVGVCWVGFAIVCLAFLSSDTGDDMKAIVGACFGFATLATCVYFGCYVYTTQQTNSRIQEVKLKSKKAFIDPLAPCALCGLYLGELCGIHRRDSQKKLSSPKKVLCPISRGKCGHTYHFHCIATYLDQCAASGRNTMCPDVSDPFLWEWGAREDKGRYMQWMSERPLGRRAQRLKQKRSLSPQRHGSGFADIEEGVDPAVTWPAPNPKATAKVNPHAFLRRQGSSSRSIGRSPSRAVPTPPTGAVSVGRARSRSRLSNSSDDSNGAPTGGVHRRLSSDVDSRVSRHRARLLRSTSERGLGSALSRGNRSLRTKSGSLRRLPPTASPPRPTRQPIGRTQLPAEIHRMKTSLDIAREDAAKARAALEREAEAKKLQEERARAAVRTAQAAWQRQTQTVEELKETVEQLQDSKLCPVCLEKARDAAFQCGHQTCMACARALDSCPLCRKPIQLRIKLYDT